MAPAHNKADVHYLLTTQLFCGNCGAMLAGESGNSHTGVTHYYYKCGTRKRNGFWNIRVGRIPACRSCRRN